MYGVTGVPQEERAQIEAVQRRLAQKFAQLPHTDIAAVVEHTYGRFDQCALRDFVPLLVERRAREELAGQLRAGDTRTLATAESHCGTAELRV